MTSRPGQELLKLIGEPALIRLAEAFGGTRLYVPSSMPADHPIVAAIGTEAASVLAERMAPDVIMVPLAREPRARQYRAIGWSNSQIARALGMTEKGVELMFRRMADAPTKGSGQIAAQPIDTNQLDLFAGQ